MGGLRQNLLYVPKQAGAAACIAADQYGCLQTGEIWGPPNWDSVSKSVNANQILESARGNAVSSVFALERYGRFITAERCEDHEGAKNKLLWAHARVRRRNEGLVLNGVQPKKGPGELSDIGGK